MENQNIKKRVRRLVKSMGWEVQPSGTWCRHSFATNLTHPRADKGVDSVGEECLIANTLYSHFVLRTIAYAPRSQSS